jgi:hypothetical protein
LFLYSCHEGFCVVIFYVYRKMYMRESGKTG